MIIKNLKARKILNSAGNWTTECSIELNNGASAAASGPSGISIGLKEKGTVTVEEAIRQIAEDIFSSIKDVDLDQGKLDQVLESQNWGSNATLAVSAAFAKASGFLKIDSVPKDPQKMMLIFEGKKHGNLNLKFQEFMAIVENTEEGVAIYKKAEEILKNKNIATTVGQEGGFSPPQLNEEEILTIMVQAGAKSIAIDVAAGQNSIDQCLLLDLIKKYPLHSVEDVASETDVDDWFSFFKRAKEINPQILVVADDLVVTDPEKIESGLKRKLFDGVIIKPNQQGTISKAVIALKVAKEYGAKTIVSHRGEETNDDWIVDFALKFEADFVKFGAPARGERVAKYNRLLYLTT